MTARAHTPAILVALSADSTSSSASRPLGRRDRAASRRRADSLGADSWTVQRRRQRASIDTLRQLLGTLREAVATVLVRYGRFEARDLRAVARIGQAVLQATAPHHRPSADDELAAVARALSVRAARELADVVDIAQMSVTPESNADVDAAVQAVHETSRLLERFARPIPVSARR